jgi:predicted amidohydrolase
MTWENKADNFSKVAGLLAGTVLPRGSLVVLPEMSFTGFSMNVQNIAEAEPERTLSFLATTAQRFGIFLVAGFVTQTAKGRGRNEAVCVTPHGELCCRYRKLHLFSPVDEHLFFEPGNDVDSFLWESGVVSPFVCYDLRFPEAFRRAADLGAELYLVIANWPRARQHHWLTLLQARAIENQAYVAGVNRCGNDPDNQYSGRSVVIAPTGEILADAGESEGIISADLDWPTLRAYRKRFPALSDRRIFEAPPSPDLSAGAPIGIPRRVFTTHTK